MCGIAGVFSFSGAVDARLVKTMTDKLFHRGPDGEGLWMNQRGQIALGHRRLAVIDLSKDAAQPMHLHQRYSITYNGEIYNYRELKTELQQLGCVFKTQSDTEVLLNAFAIWNESMLQKLDGMFAFAIWDEEKQELFCARDRFGEKPFFFHHSGTQFFFASEMKALWAAGIQKLADEKMVYRFLMFDELMNQQNPHYTFYKNIYRLEPAHFMRISREGSVIKKRYWQLSIHENKNITEQQAIETYHQLLQDSVSKRMRSDVTIGCSLSGGVDSSAILCLMNDLKADQQHLQSFSARFGKSEMDEGEFIEAITLSTQSENHQVEVDEHMWLTDFELMCYHQEEPFNGTSALAQFEVYKLAKQHGVTVLLDGQGADETLAGYKHFFNPYLRQCFLQNKKVFEKEKQIIEQLNHLQIETDNTWKFQSRFPAVAKTTSALKQKWKLNEAFDFLETDFVMSYRSQKNEYELPVNLNDALLNSTIGYGLQNLLRSADRNSMAHSREVRLPFLSHQLVEFLFTLPSSFKIKNGYTKWIHRQAMNNTVPEKNNWRISKLGFSPPEKNWMKNKFLLDRYHESIHQLNTKKYLKTNATAPPQKFFGLMALAQLV